MCLEQKVSSSPLESTGNFESHETILVVEDEEQVRKVICLTLELQGYRVFAAANAEQALAIITSLPERIQLMVVDVVLPTLCGPMLAERAQILQPELRVLYISGYTESALSEHGISQTDRNFLPKPFSSATLGRKVRQLMHG